MTKQINSPYSSSLTGGGFLQDEFDRILPLMLSPDSDALLRREAESNALLQINSMNTRKRALSELKKRFAACSPEFWVHYRGLDGKARQLAYFFVLLRTYRILFDLHLRVTVKRWMAADDSVSPEALRQEFAEIAANDDFVGSWTELTIKKVQGTYLSILRKVGFLEGMSDVLHQPSLNAEDFRYYLENGEGWFLEACLLRKYEISRMRSELK